MGQALRGAGFKGRSEPEQEPPGRGAQRPLQGQGCSALTARWQKLSPLLSSLTLESILCWPGAGGEAALWAGVHPFLMLRLVPSACPVHKWVGLTSDTTGMVPRPFSQGPGHHYPQDAGGEIPAQQLWESLRIQNPISGPVFTQRRTFSLL